MAFISDRDRQQIRDHFEKNLRGPLEVVLFTVPESLIFIPGKQSCQTCGETQELLEELTSLSDKLALTVHDLTTSRDEAESLGIDRVPAFVLKGAARGQVRFFGIPSGYEFSAFIDDVVDTANGSTGLSRETRDHLALLTEDINLKVFTTPN